MHLVIVNTSSKGGKELQTALLQESYKDGNDLKTRTIAKLMECTEDEIHAVQMAFQHKDKMLKLNLPKLPSNTHSPQVLKQNTPIGAAWVAKSVAEYLGIADALGTTKPGKLALLQILSHVVEPTLYPLSRFAEQTHYLINSLDLPIDIDAKDLHRDLTWLSKNKSKIEKRIFKFRTKGVSDRLFFYNISSPYLSTRLNPLEIFERNLDQSHFPGLGLLCDQEGYPVSICLPNPEKNQTVLDNALKLAKDYSVDSVTVVRHNSSSMEKDNIPQVANYLSHVTSPEDIAFLKAHILLDKVEDLSLTKRNDHKHFLIKRDPKRSKILKEMREDQLKHAELLINKANEKLKEQPTSSTTILQSLQRAIENIGGSEWLKVQESDVGFIHEVNQEKLNEFSTLDGCQILESNLPFSGTSPEILLDRFKNQKLIEEAFRNHSPGFHDLELADSLLESTLRGHSLLLMLAFLINRTLGKAWSPLGVTPEEGLRELSGICSMNIGNKTYITEPNKATQQLLEALNLKLPTQTDL
ncbi:MAG: hypothetical protein ACI9S8_000047 [Chlamydiales bacterium]|jgi:hypothetical protein